MSLMNNRKSLMAAIVTSALVFVIFGSLTLKNPPKQAQTQVQKFQYVVAKTDVKKGDKIKEENVEIKDFPMNIEGTYKATGEVIGRDAKMDIQAGKPVMKSFIQEILVKDAAPAGAEPSLGFRAVPLLVKKSALPPYISTEARFDLFTKENSMKIENLRILNILDPTKDESNKMLVLEIKNPDVPAFIKHQVETKGFIFLQKNAGEYGEYKFFDLEKLSSKNPAPATGSVPYIPPLEKNGIPVIEDLTPTSGIKPKKEIEVIIGNTKSKVEFED